MKKYLLILFVFLSVSVFKAEAQGIDSLNITSTYITLGEAWYTDYFTSYTYSGRSFFKDENGGLHVAFIANYKLFYCYSEDGMTWSTEQVTSTHDGDFKEAVIYADADGSPHIAATVNPYFDYGNPTGVNYGDEFRYSMYYFFKEGESWVEEEVFNSTLTTGFQGNYGGRVNELYRNLDGELVLTGNRYGWYTYGGELWEFTRNTEGTWSELSIIHAYNDTPVDHATEVSRSVLHSTGERNLIYTRPYNSSGIPELAYMNNTDGVWSAPVVLTTDLINHASWDLSVSPNEEMYLIHYSNNPTPHVNMYTDFGTSTALDVDLSGVESLQHAKILITADGILDLFVYPTGADTVLLFASEDYGVTWSAPMEVERKDFPGILPVTDQFSDQGLDLEYVRISRVSAVEPYGPDSLYYTHIDQINSSTLGISDYERSKQELSIYPNPFSEMVWVKVMLDHPGDLTIRLFTLDGKMIMSSKYRAGMGENQIPIDLKHLDSGTYIIEILDSDQSKGSMPRYTGKVVKF
jgi:hypothetical protein